MSSGAGFSKQAGVTLVELTVAVALVGISTLALMTVMADFSQRSARTQNDANLSEQLMEFSDALENIVGNATLIQSCGCGATCIYREPTPALPDNNNDDCTFAAGGCTNANLLQFEYESSNFPGQQSPANCVLGAAGAIAGSPDGLIPRGCKRRARLVYTPPVAAVAGPATQGTLSLMPEAADGTVGAQALITLPGVTFVRCGHLENPARPGFPATDLFRIAIKTKARSNNFAQGDVRFDGWHPADPTFGHGTHRSLSTDVHFRNLTTAGVMYGLAESAKNCVLDGQADPSGNNCCSRYWDPNTGLCAAATACLTRGAPAATSSLCCSHRGISGACL